MVAGPTAQAADSTLTLACKGTTTSGLEDAKPEPVSMGIIVNFTNRTVHGFVFPAKITDADEVTVSFEGSKPYSASAIWYNRGGIDRVTGDVEATFTQSDTKTGHIFASTNWLLKCRPALRMF
jgi:hypothetical protein